MKKINFGKTLFQIFFVIILMSLAIAEGGNSSENISDSVKNINSESLVSNGVFVDLEEVLNKSNTNLSFVTKSIVNNETAKMIESSDNYSYFEIKSNKSTTDEISNMTTSQSASGGSKEVSSSNFIDISKNENSIKKISVKIFKENQVEIEGRIPESFDTTSIEKREIEKNESVKRVIISSNEHLEDSLIVYSNIKEISPEDIMVVKVYWVNEEREVTVKEFLDLDKNGLYDRISWIVPHLSEQVFEIVVDPDQYSDSATPEVILISPVNNATVTNPVNLKFSVNYSGSPICTLYIDSEVYSNINLSWFNITETLNNGQHYWYVNCSGVSSGIEFFFINEAFSMTGIQNVYSFQETSIGVSIISNINKGANLTLYKPNGSPWTSSISNNGIITIPAAELNKVGKYTVEANFSGLVQPYSLSKNFSVFSMSLVTNKDSLTTSENLSININLTSPTEPIPVYTLKEGTVTIDQGTFVNLVNNTYVQSFTTSGTKTLNLSALIDTRLFSVTKQISVTNSVNGPEISLISPADNEIVKKDSVTFSYRLNGNVSINKCDFELYNGSGKIEYTTVINNPSLNIILETKLVDFDEGDYDWGLHCVYGSNILDKYNDFTISFSGNSSETNENYFGKEKVKEATDVLNNFTTLEKKFTLDEKEALEDLGITENITFFRKKLAQIKSDLSENIYQLSDEDEKDDKREEALAFIEVIIKNVPQNIDIIDQEEFTKTSIPKDMRSIVENYFVSKGVELSSREIREISNFNENLQNEISIVTNLKSLKIEFDDETREMTLVSKKIELVNESFNNIIEVLPDSVKEKVFFLIKTSKVGESIFEIELDDVDDQKIIYYTDEIVDFDEIMNSETILFEETRAVSSGITGLAILEFGGGFPWVGYFVLIILIAGTVLGYKGIIRKINISKWKNEENVRLIIENIEGAKKALKYDDTETARENYHKIKSVFGLVPQGFKKYSIHEIERIRMGIDRRDVIGFVKEFEKADLQGRKKDKEILFKKIEATYKRLPKSDREKIYKKLYRKEFDI